MISGEQAKLITIDVANDVKPRDSKLVYGKEDLEFYERIRQQFEEIKKKNPNAVLDIRE